MTQQKPMLATLKRTDLVVINPEHDYKTTAVVVSVDEVKRTIVANVLATAGDKYHIGEQSEFPFHDIEAINGRYVLSRLYHYNGWHPDLHHVVEVGEKQQLADKDQAAILMESLTFMAQKAHNERRKLMHAHMRTIHNSVSELERMGEYNEISHIGSELLRQATNIKEGVELGEHELTMLKYNKIQYRMSRLSMDELKAVLTPEAQQKYLADLDE